VPAKWQLLYALNPLVGILDGFRSALFNREFNWPTLSISIASAVALLIFSVYIFKRVEKSFADLA
jgi:lipopolysaccharide transport system permease protein